MARLTEDDEDCTHIVLVVFGIAAALQIRRMLVCSVTRFVEEPSMKTAFLVLGAVIVVIWFVDVVAFVWTYARMFSKTRNDKPHEAE